MNGEGLRTTDYRSALMKRVRRSDTSAEVAVRRLLRELGGHYRVNVSGLPGSPDIAHKGRRKAIFVNGCFWHFHRGCPRGRIPKRNKEFWRTKLTANRRRDEAKVRALRGIGFDVLTIWECELENAAELRRRIGRFWWKES